MKFVIYCHTCRTNGKSYVGLTSLTIEKRWIQHCHAALKCKSQLLFHRAIRKYGTESWDHEILDVLYTEQGAKHAEMLWIKQRASFAKEGKGYNSTLGGDGTIGYIFTPEQRKKIGDAVRNHFADPIARQKKIDSCNRPEIRERNSIAQKIAQNRPEVRERKVASFKLTVNKPEIKKKMRESSQRRWSDPEERRKNRDRLNDPIVKEKISRATRRSVEQYTLDGKFVARYESLTEAGRVANLNVNSICQYCRGKRQNPIGGFRWNYCVSSSGHDNYQQES